MMRLTRLVVTFGGAIFLSACNSGGPSSPRDTIAPVISLTGDNPQVFGFGEPYTELGATASDNKDGNLSASIVIDTSSVDTSTPGDYTVTYNVTDAAGNAATTVTRTLTVQPPVPEKASVTVESDIKRLIFNWDEIEYVEYYRLMENPDGHSGFSQVGHDIPAVTLSAKQAIAVHLFDWANAQYIVEACNSIGCNSSEVVTVFDVVLDAIGYFKASNTGANDYFGQALALSADGLTMAVGALEEDSGATGINGDQTDNSANAAGAVYLFRFDGTDWIQQAYVKASNTDAGDRFGDVVALSADGNTLAVGAGRAEAAYLFRFDGNEWTQQAEIKASNASSGFGGSVSLSADGNTLAVGASSAGAAYLFWFDGVDWAEQAYIQPSDADADISFGHVVVLSGDGNTLAVGAPHTGWPLFAFGTVYVFRYDGLDWTQQANLSTLASYWDMVGSAIALSADGNRLAVGVANKDRIPPGKDCGQEDCSDEDSGAVYVLRWNGADWTEQAYITASNPDIYDGFGDSVALSADGNTLAVGTGLEDSSATGVNGDQTDNSAGGAGAVYLFLFDSMNWSQRSYIKASNTDARDGFGDRVVLSADGNTLAVGAHREDSNATGINGGQSDNSAEDSGAVYVY